MLSISIIARYYTIVNVSTRILAIYLKKKKNSKKYFRDKYSHLEEWYSIFRWTGTGVRIECKYFIAKYSNFRKKKNSKKRSSFGSMDRSFPLADSTWKECSIIRYCYIISLFITGTMVTCTTKSTSCELISPREV